MKRVIDLSEEPAALSVRYDQLIIRRNKREDSVPLNEIVALVVSHPAVHYTHAVLSGICEHGGSFILCDLQRLPVGMLLPLKMHCEQTERLPMQIKASPPAKKRLWKQVVIAKVKAQGKLLRKCTGDDCGLLQLAGKVKSGDAGNIESQASRIYWQALFGCEFRRLPGSRDGINSLLNYGYALLRAATARGICAVGLHPSLGIHHHNRYDAFCLASDLMEPFRPLIDEVVRQLVGFWGDDVILDKDSKTLLIQQILTREFNFGGEARKLFDIVALVAASLMAVYAGKRSKLKLPEIKNV